MDFIKTACGGNEKQITVLGEGLGGCRLCYSEYNHVEDLSTSYCLIHAV